jgi:hypothetical protein
VEVEQCPCLSTLAVRCLASVYPLQGGCHFGDTVYPNVIFHTSIGLPAAGMAWPGHVRCARMPLGPLNAT